MLRLHVISSPTSLPTSGGSLCDYFRRQPLGSAPIYFPALTTNLHFAITAAHSSQNRPVLSSASYDCSPNPSSTRDLTTATLSPNTPAFPGDSPAPFRIFHPLTSCLHDARFLIGFLIGRSSLQRACQPPS